MKSYESITYRYRKCKKCNDITIHNIKLIVGDIDKNEPDTILSEECLKCAMGEAWYPPFEKSAIVLLPWLEGTKEGL